MSFEPKQPVPVFPLPGVVLFPGVRLPLRVFELRYRALVRDALSTDRVLALAVLLPGWERDYHGSPEFHPLGCAAKIEQVNWLPDDGYDLVVHGVSRVQLGPVVREFPYRTVRCQGLPQDPFTEDDTLVQLERRAVIDAGTRCARMDAAPDAPPLELDVSLGFEELVNRLCMGLVADSGERLELLAMDSVIDRARRMRELLEGRLMQAGRSDAAGGERN